MKIVVRVFDCVEKGGAQVQLFRPTHQLVPETDSTAELVQQVIYVDEIPKTTR